MEDSQLQELRAALLDGLREHLDPGEGERAFERHQLLAIRFHRVARLNQPWEKKYEGRGWIRFFTEHFPRGDGHAELLWTDWRVTLLKDDSTGPGVSVTHGQPDAHWQISHPSGRLIIDLESMWDDYEASIAHESPAVRATLHCETERCAAGSRGAGPSSSRRP